MKNSRYLAALAVAVMIVSSVGSLRAQAPGAGLGTRPAAGGVRPTAAPAAASGGSASTAARGSTPSVVVIDIGEVFKQHAQFNQQLNGLKDEIKSLDAYYQAEQKKIVGQKDKLGTFNAGSPEYKKLEEEVARMASDLQVEMALKQKNVAEQEAKVYFNTYKEIYKQVETFADTYGITLVLRHNNIQMDPQKRDTVLQGVNRAIVFQRNLDITDEIVKRVNTGSASSTPGTARNPASPALPKR